MFCAFQFSSLDVHRNGGNQVANQTQSSNNGRDWKQPLALMLQRSISPIANPLHNNSKIIWILKENFWKWLTCARAGFCGSITPAKLKRNASINEAMVMKVVTKLSSMLGTVFRIQTIQNFRSATTNHKRKTIRWMECRTTCNTSQKLSGIGPYQALMRSNNSMTPQYKISCKKDVDYIF